MMHKKGYVFLNILVVCALAMGLFSLVLGTMALIKRHYRAKINELDIKAMLEARAILLTNTTNLTKKLDLGWVDDDKFSYQVTKENGTYKLEIKYYEVPDLIYYQLFDSRYTRSGYQYIIYEEGYRGD
ncbi:MAG: hypothetical protein J5666_06505 [Bacilli bacterium]|nr:hypothetical protein [Bacilli bacterium]